MLNTKEYWYVVQAENLVVAGPFLNFEEANQAMDWIMDRRPGSFEVANSSELLEEGAMLAP